MHSEADLQPEFGGCTIFFRSHPLGNREGTNQQREYKILTGKLQQMWGYTDLFLSVRLPWALLDSEGDAAVFARLQLIASISMT